MKLDYRNIFEYSQDPIEYMFIDKADINPGQSGKGIKCLSFQDWYFKIHFPGDPIVPGVLLMESLLEMGTLIICTIPQKAKKRVVFSGCDNVRLSGEARPGDVLELYAEVHKYKRGVANFSGTITKNQEEILKMDFTLAVPDEMLFKSRAEQSRAEQS